MARVMSDSPASVSGVLLSSRKKDEAAGPGASPVAAADSAARGLGTLSGVLIPTCENMWGVLIFLRFFYIVGNAGIWQSFIIVILSFLCALLTTMSLNAIATNGPIEEGGTYYLISRALGPRLGGAVGCLYFLGVLLLAVLESLGAVEVIVFAFPALHFPSANRAIGAVLLLVLGILVYFGIKFVSKLGILFFLVVIYTMLSYYLGLFTAPRSHSPPSLTGLSWNTFQSNWDPAYDKGVSFSVAVSIFFPCFTGILSGADRAKNLKRPEKSIPAGTLGAVFISLVLYLSYMGLWAAVGTREYLLGDEKLLVVKDVAFPWAIVTEVGIIIASLSQALQCLTTSPRLLQAIASDGVVPLLNHFAKTSSSGEPRRAVIFTTGLCMVAAMIGSLDAVAPLVSICFLTCYSALNLSCFVLSVLKAPSWRPKWKFYHAVFALVGFLLCLAMNFVILWYWAVAAVVMLLLIYMYIDWRQVEVDWGTGLGGLRLQYAVQSLLSVGHEARYSVNWRPQLLCLSKPQSSWATDGHAGKQFLAFASQLKKGKGLCVVTVILEGQLAEMAAQIAAEKLELENIMEEVKVTGFGRILAAPSYRQGKTSAIQSSGLGALEPNTLVIGWPQRWKERGHEEGAEIFLETLDECKALEKAVLLCMHLDQFPSTERQEGVIDVWWIVHDGGLLLLLAHLLTRHKIWRKCKLRVHTVAEKLDNSEQVRTNLKKILDQVRIEAEVEVLELDDAGLAPYTFDYTIRTEEARAYAEQLASLRHRRDDQPTGRNRRRGQVGIDSPVRLNRISEQTSASKQDEGRVKKGVLSAVPGELSMIQGAAHTPRTVRRYPDSTEDYHDGSFRDLKHDPADELAAQIPRLVSSSEQLVGGTSFQTEMNRETSERRTLGRLFAGSDEPVTEVEVVIESPRVSTDLEDAEAAERGTNHSDEYDVEGEGGRPPIRVGSAGQLYPGSPHQTQFLSQHGLEPISRTWETFSQNYSPKHLNDLIVEQSKDAQLVLINLPDHYKGMVPSHYMQYCEELTRGLDRVLFVRGTGREMWGGG